MWKDTSSLPRHPPPHPDTPQQRFIIFSSYLLSEKWEISRPCSVQVRKHHQNLKQQLHTRKGRLLWICLPAVADAIWGCWVPRNIFRRLSTWKHLNAKPFLPTTSYLWPSRRVRNAVPDASGNALPTASSVAGAGRSTWRASSHLTSTGALGAKCICDGRAEATGYTPAQHLWDHEWWSPGFTPGWP